MNNPEQVVPKSIRKLEEEYKKSKNLYKKSYYTTQILFILLSGITPILLIPENFPKIIPGITAGLASAIAAASNALKLREKYALNKITHEVIRSEIAKFEEKDDEVRKILVESVFASHLKRLEEWKEMLNDTDLNND